jgi:asparagine synthase (glutamine-hydrolysing)
MCGIYGCIAMHRAGVTDDLREMSRALTPRGPDGGGVWRAADGSCLLGHTRLSIIDLAGSAQPMTNEDGSVVVTFNGEIYNFRELRAELRADGHVLKSAGDTEVLVHLYEKYGAAMVERLDGMFAFALYDERRHLLLLARDRIGIKPLHVWREPSGGLVFASDLQALLRHPRAPRRLQPRALAQFLGLGYVTAPLAWVDEVSQVEPGQYLLWQDGAVTATRYYSWTYQPDDALTGFGPAVEQLESTLGESVRHQLVADVPLGSFLSGGLDSGAITGLAQRAAIGAGKALASFTVSSSRPDLDESSRARAVAHGLGTRHTQIAAESLPFDRDTVTAIVDGLGEPFGDSSALAVYQVCRAARRHVKVALSGDGGDELFLGYTGMRRQALARRLRAAPALLRRGTAALSRGARSTLLRRVHKYTRLSLRDDANLILDASQRWEWEALAGLLDPAVFGAAFPCPDRPFPEITDRLGNGRTGGFAEQQIRFHLLVDLPGDCLTKVDRMSMAHGLEVRVPMLSNRMLEYAAALPLTMRTRQGRRKEPLRSVAEGIAPTLSTPFAKHGFEFPLDGWMRGSLAESWRAWGITRHLSSVGFMPGPVDAMVAAYDAAPRGRPSHATGRLSTQLYDLLLLGIWVERNHVAL